MLRSPALITLGATFPFLAAALWPAPQDIEQGDAVVRLATDFSISLDEGLQDLSDLGTAVKESQDRILTDNLKLLQVDRGANLTDAVTSASELAGLKLSLGDDCKSDDGTIDDISKETLKAFEQRDESYELQVAGDGASATVTSCSSLGLFRGLTTFEQLVYVLPEASTSTSKKRRKRGIECPTDSNNSGVRFIQNAPVHITDAPAFPWRGLLVDTARNYFAPASIKKTILTASYAKLSVFYWHITDSQSFPLELSDDLVNITTLGAYDLNSVYRSAQVQEIIAYANRLGIDVVFEIDSPGHTASIGAAYPDLIACLDQSPWATYAAEPQSGQINIAKPEATSLAQSIYAELASISNSRYVSTGGDEVNAACYELPEVSDLLKESDTTVEQALKAYTEAIHGTLRDADKTPVVWEEQVLDHKVGLAGTDVPVIVWVNSTSIEKVTKLGNPLIHAASDYFYLDCGAGGWVGDNLGQSWCDYVSWQQTYSFNPMANMTEEAAKKVLGGQAQVWTEQVDATNLEEVLWPRAGATAEVFWTGQAEKRDAVEAMHRLHDWRYRLVQRGVNARPLQPQCGTFATA